MSVYFTPGKKHPVLILAGYEFKLFRRSPTNSVWACTQNVKHRCKVRLLTRGGQLQIKAVAHSHAETFRGNYDHLFSQKLSVSYCDKLSAA